jgi:hypothetical protein
VWFRTHVTNGWRPVQITIAELPAKQTPEPDDFVMVGGHQDSWPGEAATDNAAGSAIMIELARCSERHQPKLRRGLLFGFWTAHETGNDGGLRLVCRPQLGPAARPCLRLSADRPALVHRHHDLAHDVERRS